MNPYQLSSETFVQSDANVMDAVRTHLWAVRAAITKLRESAHITETEDRLDDLLCGLIDLEGDHVSPTITKLEERLGDFERARDRDHEGYLRAAQ